MLFIAFCRVTQTPYMNDSKQYVKTHLVEADDETQARKKLEAHYDKMCDSYAVDYRVDILDIEETIT